MSDADGSPEVTERLLKQSRELLDAIGDRLGDEDGSVALDPTVTEDDEPDA